MVKTFFSASFLILSVVVLEAIPVIRDSDDVRPVAVELDERGLLNGLLGGEGGLVGELLKTVGGVVGGEGGAEGGLQVGVSGGGGEVAGGSGLLSGLLGGILGGGQSSGLLGGNLLGGILGGGQSSGLLGGNLLSGILGGGQSGGLLGGNLLGNILGGGNGTGLLGGLIGQTGLLGSILGGGGSGNSSLLGGLLGGKGGLLGGLVGADGIVGLLNKVLCLLSRLGLNVVSELVQGLNVDKLLGLNLICKDPKGGDLLSLLFSNGTNLPLVDKVLCWVKSLGTKQVFDVIQKIGVNNAFQFLNANCTGGPLFEANSTVADIVSKLLLSLDVKYLLQGGVSAVVDLAKLLASVNVGDVSKVVAQLLCLLKQLRLNFVVDLIKTLGLNAVLNITNTYCQAGEPLFGHLVQVTGLPLQEVLVKYGCLINFLGLGFVEARIAVNQLNLLVKLNTLCSSSGGGALIETLLKTGLNTDVLVKVACVFNGLKPDAAQDLISVLDVQKLIRLQEIICPAGSQLVNLTSSTGKLFIELILRFGVNATASINLTDVPRIEKIISSLSGSVDLKTLLEKLSCSINQLGLVTALITIEPLGLTAATSLSTSLCDVGSRLSSSNSLKILVDNIGPDVSLGLINQLGVDFVVTLANSLVVNGQFLGAELLKEILCVLQAIGVQALQDILKQTGAGNFLDVYKYFCPKGQPLRLSANAEFFGPAVIDCRLGTTPACASSLETAVTLSCDRDCPGACQSLPLKAEPKSLCSSYCLSLCIGG